MQIIKGKYNQAHVMDEAPGAYKDMSVILENIKETVDVIEMIKPMYNFKGSTKEKRK